MFPVLRRVVSVDLVEELPVVHKTVELMVAVQTAAELQSNQPDSELVLPARDR